MRWTAIGGGGWSTGRGKGRFPKRCKQLQFDRCEGRCRRPTRVEGPSAGSLVARIRILLSRRRFAARELLWRAAPWAAGERSCGRNVAAGGATPRALLSDLGAPNLSSDAALRRALPRCRA